MTKRGALPSIETVVDYASLVILAFVALVGFYVMAFVFFTL